MRFSALAGLGGHGSKLLAADRRVDQVSQDQARCFGLAVEEQDSSFVEQCLRERRLALDPFDHGLLEIMRQCHETRLFLFSALAFITRAFLRALYSASVVLGIYRN